MFNCSMISRDIFIVQIGEHTKVYILISGYFYFESFFKQTVEVNLIVISYIVNIY